MHAQAQATSVRSAADRAAAGFTLDGLVQSVNAALLGAVLWKHHVLPHAAAFVACHVIFALSVYLLSKREQAPGVTDPLHFVHDWLPAVFILGMYFELGLLIPLLRDYSDLRYDRALHAIDLWLFGDPLALIQRHGSALLSDLLTLCYFAYYPLALVVPATLYVRGDKRGFRSAATVILVGFVVSYIGYVAWPALGPHRVFDGQRPSALDGFGLSRIAYAWLLAVPYEPPDAFPSGHALISMLVPALAWHKLRALFYVCAPICLGIILATLYLRLHYVADVAAALLIAPVCYRLGRAIS